MSVEERIRVLFADQLNLARGKYVPRSYAERGNVKFCLGAYAVTYCRKLIDAPGAKMLEGLPDLEAVFDLADAVQSWEDNCKIVIADLEFEGEPLPMCGRSLLKRTLAAWQKRGYTAKIGIELEAFVFQRGENGAWVPYDTPGAYVYGTGPATDPAGLMDDIWKEAMRCGFKIESMNSEYDSPQFELTLKYDDALKAIDDVFLFKLMARELAFRKGFLLCFMPKPLEEAGGSGLHVNFSLWDKDGNNAFADTSEADGLSSLAKQCVAGLVEHHEGMAGLLAPTTNSYRRLTADSLAGYWASWGYDHRGATTRVSNERGKGTRLEHRQSDCAVSPYVAAATVLQAALLGVTEGYDIPQPETGDSFETVSTDRHTPPDLASALKALKADTKLVAALGETFVANFLAIKEAELEEAEGKSSEWEFNYYSPFI
ncbi:glutamine synthetase family protein [Kordiimonas pumila]|uniref:Glutamine synthetase family protein n=1 Tax=Kordiimonas pumila TaxID=2161677 RepID=A0ABV7D5H7_9PROT|nr:glutamine synthetase family protein [Kordiimonas pumila]